MADSSDPLSGLGGELGGTLGYFLTSGNRKAAEDDYRKGEQAYENVDPNIAAKTAGSTAFNQVALDPTDRASQLDALGQLQGIYRSGGLDDATKAKINAANTTADRNVQALNNNVKNEMAQRGLGSSGASFANQEINNQGAANQANEQGQAALEQGEANRMGAISGAAQIGAGLQGQDFSQAAKKAEAQDSINKFNANQMQTAEQQTVGNQLGRAQGQQAGYGQMAGDQTAQGKQEIGATTSMGAGVGNILGEFL